MSGTIFEADAKALHEAIQDGFRNAARRDRPTVVTLFSLNDNAGGQWIIGDKAQDPAAVAKRLRLAADIIGASADAPEGV